MEYIEKHKFGLDAAFEGVKRHETCIKYTVKSF